MSSALTDLERDPDRLLHRLQQMTEVITRQDASLVSLQAEYDTALAATRGSPTPLTVVRGDRPRRRASRPVELRATWPAPVRSKRRLTLMAEVYRQRDLRPS